MHSRQVDGATTTLGNLPASVTSLVGRRRELAAVDALTREQRLVTLCGAGGIGKTTLALEVARLSAERYRDGAWLVELAPLSTGESLASIVLSSIKLSRRSGPTPTETVVATLAERSVLVVLDNCEHVVDAAADLASTLLRNCPSVHLLATSREVLSIAGETTFSVPPMERPDRRDARTIHPLEALEAVQLFLVRAGAARPGFALTQQNCDAVAEICWRLDGIPLAIELAAARVRGLPIDAIAERLAGQADLLSSRSRTTPPRQRTLRATLDWSHDLLNDDEQRLFRQLAVFRGGFTLDAAERICLANPHGAPRPGIADELADLVDKSLVLLEEGADRPARYRLLEPVREYGETHLRAAGEAAPLGARHAGYYIELAHAMLDGRRGVDEAWFVWAAADLDNLRAAFEWALQHEPHAALRLALALKHHWMLREGGEGLDWLDRALRESQVQDLDRAEALRTLSVWSTFNGSFDVARDLARESLALAGELGSRAHRGYALLSMGILATAEAPDGWSRDALAFYAEGETMLRDSGDRWTLALLLNSYGYTLYKSGDADNAIARLQEGLAIADELDDPTLRGILFGSVADARLTAGDRHGAEESWNVQLRNAGTIGAWSHTSEALQGLARIARDDGDLERSVVLLGAATESSRRVGAQGFSLDSSFVNQTRHMAEQELGAQRATHAFERGATMSPHEATRFALEDAGESASDVPADTAQNAATGANHLLREGDYWTLGFEGRVIRVKDSKGIRDLARLLSAMGREISCQELAFGELPRAQHLQRRQSPADTLAVEAGVGPILDAEAREEYRRRLVELETEIDEADSDNNAELASRLRLEREFVLREVKAAVGLGGRDRDALDPGERARKAVTGRIRDAIKHIETDHPQLGKHLRYSVRTGAFCSYVPPYPTTWRVGPVAAGGSR